jgi:hypothetical protein
VIGLSNCGTIVCGVIFLSKVEDVFRIPGRGCAVVPALPGPNVDFRLRTHDSIQLRNPDGRVFNTYIASIEMVCGAKVSCRMAFLLPGNITMQDVPRETENLADPETMTQNRSPLPRNG